MKLSVLKKLSLSQIGWVLEAYFRLWFVKCCLRFCKPSWLSKRIHLTTAQSEKSNGPKSNSFLRAELMHEAVRIAARMHFINCHCLPKSIVLTAMLGSKAQLLIGIAKQYDETTQKSKIASHAWVEFEGLMVSEPLQVEGTFVPLLSPDR